MFLRFRAYLLSYLMLTCIGAYSQESLKQWFDEAKQFDLNYLNHVHALAQAKQNQQLAKSHSLISLFQVNGMILIMVNTMSVM